MTDSAVASAERKAGQVPGWAAAVALLIAAAVAGPLLGSLARPAFIFGCGAVGWYTWRQGPAAHLQATLLLFAFAPFVRRLVDLAAGFDDTGLMLVGPLFTILAAASELRHGLGPNRPAARQMGPVLLVGACVTYATALSAFQGDWMNAATGSIKWFAPLVYAAALLHREEQGDGIVQAAASTFAVILPVMGVYGIFQYIDPPEWDRYWMNFASITSAGEPKPYGVRTFSTMNGPASFATFTAAGLMLVCVLRSGWQALVLAAPAALSLLLSMYRTSWLSLAVGVLYCLLFASTRKRATRTLLGLAGAIVAAGTLTPFGEVIGDRLSTLGEGAEDGSARERLDEILTLWTLPDSGLLGIGFTTSDVGSAGAIPVDGMIVACWLFMGIVVGLICLAGLVWAAVNAMDASRRDGRREAVLVGALAAGALIQMPLANIASGELGFLFWTFAVLAPRADAWTRAW